MAAKKQIELFVHNMVDASLRDHQPLMEFPFFSLSKKMRMSPFIYDNKGVSIRVDPGAKGMATIWDRDLLVYLASVIVERRDNNQAVDRTIQFSAHDFFVATNRGTGKAQYLRFQDTLYRLRTTTITTNIVSKNITAQRGFGWLEDWQIIEKPHPKTRAPIMVAVEVTLNRWMFESILRDNSVLTINSDYFKLTGGLQKRLYELARKHCGSQVNWQIAMSSLALKCGTATSELRQFRRYFARAIKDQPIPDYLFEVIDNPDPKIYKFAHKKKGNFKDPLVLVTPKSKSKTTPTITETIVETVPPVQNLFLSGDDTDKAKRIAPGYDIYFLEQEWRTATLRKAIIIKKPGLAFHAWLRTFITNNPL